MTFVLHSFGLFYQDHVDPTDSVFLRLHNPASSPPQTPRQQHFLLWLLFISLRAIVGWNKKCNARRAQSESISPVRSASVYIRTTTVAFVIVLGSFLPFAGRCGSAKWKGQLWRYNTGSICGSLREPPPAAIICYNPTAATKPNTWRAVNRICGTSIVHPCLFFNKTKDLAFDVCSLVVSGRYLSCIQTGGCQINIKGIKVECVLLGQF